LKLADAITSSKETDKLEEESKNRRDVMKICLKNEIDPKLIFDLMKDAEQRKIIIDAFLVCEEQNFIVFVKKL
jgi:hypothetical protein